MSVGKKKYLQLSENFYYKFAVFKPVNLRKKE